MIEESLNGSDALVPAVPPAITLLIQAGLESIKARSDARKRELEEQERQAQAGRELAWLNWEQAVRRLLPPELLPFVDFAKIINPEKEPDHNEAIFVEIPGIERLCFNVLTNRDGERRLDDFNFSFYDLELKPPERYPDDDDDRLWRIGSAGSHPKWKVTDLAEGLALACKVALKRRKLQAEADARNEQLRREEEERRAREWESIKTHGAAQAAVPTVDDEEREARELEKRIEQMIADCSAAGPRFLNHLLIKTLRELAYQEGGNACSNWMGAD